MADTVLAPLTQGTESTIPRLKLTETGAPGLTVIGGNVFEGCIQELQWPWCIHTFNKMRRDATISSAVQLLETMISKVKWKIEIPHNASDDLKRKKQYLEEVIEDMDTSFLSVIKEISSFNTYGFSVMEKVFRRRLKSQGSYYNDGLVGIKKLAPRGQETISKWEFDDNNRVLQGIRQWTSKQGTNGDLQYEIAPGVLIPREKFLLFRTNVRKDNPIGESPLVYCWQSWKFKQALEEAEAIGISKDMRGLPILYMPAQYMVDGASEQDKAVYEYMKKVMRNLHREEQEGLILPTLYEEGHRLFDFELAGVSGSKSFNVSEIINRYSNEILMSFFADVLKLGQGATGSYSLADSKTSIIATRVEAALMEIQDQLNNDLVKQLAELNGWNPTQMPKFSYGDIDERSIDDFSKAIQRIKATSMITPTPGNINYIAETLGLPDRVDENMPQEELNELLGVMTSNSGEGMESGLSSGTGNADGSSGDSSISNTENT